MARLKGVNGFWVFCLIFLFVSAAPAQMDVTTSRVSGIVRTTDGSPLPGVTVEAKNQDTGLAIRDVSDSDGLYHLINLPTGHYTLTAALSGFNTVSRPGVSVVLGSTPTVNFTLGLSGVAETITVTSATPVVEVTNTTASTTISTEQLQGLPSGGRDFKQLALLAPQTRIESERGTLSISGERGINTSVMVDGVDYNNPFFGGAAGGAEGRAPLSLSQESIKEFTVITNGASVEFGRSGGGFVNVITKSGTNQLKGGVFYFNQPQSLVSNFADGRPPADQQKKQYGGSIGGPILRDRLFFFGSYDKQDQNITIPLNQTLLDAEIFAKYPALVSTPQLIRTSNGHVAFGRMDFQATPAHRFTLRGNLVHYEGDNGTFESQNRASTNNGLEGSDSKIYVGQYSGVFGSNFVNDLNGTYVKENTPRQDKTPNLPEIRFGSFTYGGVSFLPIVSTVQRKAFSDTVSYIWKHHIVKAGTDYNDTSVAQTFKGNWRGVFSFNNKANFLAGKWSQYFQFGGLGGRTADEAGSVNFGQKELAFFLQDQWFVTSNLTAVVGLRGERLNNPDQPILNALDPNPDGSFKLNGKIPDINNQWSPRIGVSWSPDGSRTVIRASAGRFWSRTPALLWSQLFSSNGLQGTQYTINTTNFTTGPTDPLSPGWGGAFNPVGVQRIDFTKIPTPKALGVFTVLPSFTNPHSDRITVMAERELFPETAAGLEVTYAKVRNLERLTDLNLQYDGTLAANGQPRFSTTRPNPFYGRISTYTSDAESRYRAVGATFRRRFAQGFRAYAAITWSRDRDTDSNERNFAGTQVEDFYNLQQNWGYANRDQRWRGNINSIWDTPFWGIHLAGTYRYSSGSPFTATRGDDANRDGFNTTDRPTVGGVHFVRNSFRQPGFHALDVRLGKDFTIPRVGQLKIFADCFNCTDAENRLVGNTTWGTGETPLPTFGLASNVTTTPRTIQVAARFDF